MLETNFHYQLVYKGLFIRYILTEKNRKIINNFNFLYQFIDLVDSRVSSRLNRVTTVNESFRGVKPLNKKQKI